MALTKPDLRVANRVFSALKQLKLPPMTFADLYVNGRERGYTVRTSNRAVSFSENRNSDQIVVYFGNYTDFDGAGVPNETAWEAREYFAPRGEKQAARAIAKHLKD